jgi:hypothetical protein
VLELELELELVLVRVHALIVTPRLAEGQIVYLWFRSQILRQFEFEFEFEFEYDFFRIWRRKSAPQREQNFHHHPRNA